MKKVIFCFLLALALSCSKSRKEQASSMEWLNAKKLEYGNCHCLAGFRRGFYQDQLVIEIYGFDPLCDGINIVYRADGTPWFNSADRAIYEDYNVNVKDRQVIWTCSKANAPATK